MVKQENIIVFSDIHGDLEKITMFREGIRGFKYGSVYCLGDFVQNGADFSENRAIEVARELKPKCIKGNHDEDLVSKSHKIQPTNLDFIFGLERHIVEGDMLFFHSSLVEYGRRLNGDMVIKEEAEYVHESYPYVKSVFFGHTHNQGIYSYDPQKRELSEHDDSMPVRFEEGKIYLINPGALGFSPKESSFAVFDPEEKTCRIMTLQHLRKISAIRYLILKFEEEWMPHLTGDSWCWKSLDEEVKELKRSTYYELYAEIISILTSFKPSVVPTSQKKRYYLEFSRRIAEALEELTTEDVLKYYDVNPPVKTWNYYRSTKPRTLLGVDCDTPLEVIE